jgi:putative chitobiose transport system permease protein
MFSPAASFPIFRTYWRSIQSVAPVLWIYLLLSAIAVVLLFPLVWLFATAFKPATEGVFSAPWALLPAAPTLDNLIAVWNTGNFSLYLFNSTVIAILSVGLNLLFCALAAYPLARLEFQGKGIIFSAIVSTITIPFQIVMIPLYILTVQLGLVNTYLGAILPNLASAFGIFLLREAFQSVPKELEEAARIDGCSELGIWWNVMLPAVRPALVTLGIFVFIGAWSDFLWPLIILQSEDYYTLPLGVAKLAGTFGFNWRLVAAGSIISIAPVVCLFIFVQRYIVPTAVSTGVKG